MSVKSRTVAFIPVRGGSKSIPLKNIKIFCGQPLVYWTAKAADDCSEIDTVYIATDSEKIYNTVKNFNLHKIKLIGRSVETSTDSASTESAMLEFATNFDFDVIVLIQATSPLLTSHDLSRGISKYREGNYDSLLSVVPQKRFIWNLKGEAAVPQNYDPLQRPRRQDMLPYFVENGAFYITSRQKLLESKCRISGKIGLCEMPEDTYFEIDEPSDWIVMEELKKKCSSS